MKDKYYKPNPDLLPKPRLKCTNCGKLYRDNVTGYNELCDECHISCKCNCHKQGRLFCAACGDNHIIAKKEKVRSNG